MKYAAACLALCLGSLGRLRSQPNHIHDGRRRNVDCGSRQHGGERPRSLGCGENAD